MSMTEWLALIILGIMALVIIVPLITFTWIYILDRRQKEHSVLRNYPVLGNVRYFLESANIYLPIIVKGSLFHGINTKMSLKRGNIRNGFMPSDLNATLRSLAFT